MECRCFRASVLKPLQPHTLSPEYVESTVGIWSAEPVITLCPECMERCRGRVVDSVNRAAYLLWSGVTDREQRNGARLVGSYAGGLEKPRGLIVTRKKVGSCARFA